MWNVGKDSTSNVTNNISSGKSIVFKNCIMSIVFYKGGNVNTTALRKNPHVEIFSVRDTILDIIGLPED